MPEYVTAMFPLKITDGSIGYDQIAREDIKRIVYQHLEFVLYTRPGEIISDHQFGVGIEDYLFLHPGETKLMNLGNVISTHISRYITYLTGFDVKLLFDKNDFNRLGVRIKYSIDHLDVEEVADFIIIQDN